MRAKKRIYVTVLACAIFCFVTIASMFYIAEEENHQCTGDKCPICSCVRLAEQVVKNIGTAKRYILPANLYPTQGAFLCAVIIVCVLSASLVSQKVRIDS